MNVFCLGKFNQLWVKRLAISNTISLHEVKKWDQTILNFVFFRLLILFFNLRIFFITSTALLTVQITLTIRLTSKFALFALLSPHFYLRLHEVLFDLVVNVLQSLLLYWMFDRLTNLHQIILIFKIVLWRSKPLFLGLSPFLKIRLQVFETT